MSNETGKKNEYLIEVKDLKQHFPIKTGFMKSIPLKAVDGVSFSIKPGETLGLVGESGCGKTTVGRTLLHLYTPTSGEILFDGKPVTTKTIHEMRKEMQMVFQDPYSSLNPRMTVEDIIGEPLDVHKLYSSKEERREKILNLMKTVGLNAEHATRYAHEFSGGQRQRIGIARALATNPRFIVCDEAVSALDVSIQAQVINMFEELQEKLGMAYLFIAHDLLVVRHISDRIAVMYLGRIVEIADADELCEEPVHPYTQSLLSAVPYPDPKMAKERQRIVLEAMLNKAKGAGIDKILEICRLVFDDISTTLTLNEILDLAKDVTNYSIKTSAGFPYELVNRNLAGSGDTVVPVDLAANVSRLHNTLFGTENYTPSFVVQTISQTIIDKTGVTPDTKPENTNKYDDTHGQTGTK